MAIIFSNFLGKCYLCGKKWCEIHDKHFDECSCKKEKSDLTNPESEV